MKTSPFRPLANPDPERAARLTQSFASACAIYAAVAAGLLGAAASEVLRPEFTAPKPMTLTVSQMRGAGQAPAPAAPSPARSGPESALKKTPAKPLAPTPAPPPEPTPKPAPVSAHAPTPKSTPVSKPVPAPSSDPAPTPSPAPGPAPAAAAAQSSSPSGPAAPIPHAEDSAGGAAAKAGPISANGKAAGKADARAAAAGGPETLVYGESKDPFLEAVLSAIRGSLRYPPRAADKGWQGAATMEFTVNAEGRIQSLRVFESSGRAILDRAAQSAVEKAASLWGAPRRPVKIRVPVRFSLKRQG